MGEYRRIIAENLRRICKLKGVRQVDISNRLGVSQGSVSNWMKGINSIDIENLAILSEFLGVTLNQICGIEPLTTSELLSPGEAELLGYFRSVNDQARAAILTTARGLAGNPDMKKEDGSAETA